MLGDAVDICANLVNVTRDKSSRGSYAAALSPIYRLLTDVLDSQDLKCKAKQFPYLQLQNRWPQKGIAGLAAFVIRTVRVPRRGTSNQRAQIFLSQLTSSFRLLVSQPQIPQPPTTRRLSYLTTI